ncbi:uncharacterized protein L201_004467 [Kwoniella dendrophila CBS 6074]|uniref:Zn(2)-C6 fungal-type domain-containing protein n=1 Tax=Kwoniella dendrophila CBS 6074 TaxID=1295534 RepID=A0AAX4JXG5_9TREE
MARPYNPKYDSMLGPMREPSPPTNENENENAFQRDDSFLSQLGTDKLGVGDTEAALKHLFGDVVGNSSHHDDDHHHHLQHHEQNNVNIEDSQNKHDTSMSIETGNSITSLNNDGSTPTLASHEVTTTESIPISTPHVNENNPNPSTGLNNQDVNITLDPALKGFPLITTNQTEGENGEQVQQQEQPKKRKATSRANMLARGGACEFCKKRKLKCSAELPSCSNCLRTGKECIYSQKKQRSRVRILEDRLQELEKRLDKSKDDDSDTPLNIYNDNTHGNEILVGEHNVTNANQGQLENINTTSTTIPNEMYDSSDFPTLSTFDLGSTPIDLSLQNEPDLMTLADAAAGDSSIETELWEGLSPEVVVNEILKAISGGNHNNGKSVGEKIVSHLIQLYILPPSVPDIHAALSPSSLLSRLSNKTDRPIHPALLLSLIPFVLPLSPSKTLHHPNIPIMLQQHGQKSIQQAISNSDSRMIDLIASCTIRSYGFYGEARFFEGWTESALATSMVYASGLSKLGHVGEKFVNPLNVNSNFQKMRKDRLEKEKKFRLVKSKGVAVPPPNDKAELAERIKLFWAAYMNDRGGSIGWGWPSSFNDEDITTPWPHDDFENDESLLDNRTVTDFMNSTTPNDATKDNIIATQAKSMTLMFHAHRLFDVSPDIATPDRTSRLMRMTRGYMSTITPVHQIHSNPGVVNGEGSNYQLWITLHTIMSCLHAKEEIDAPSGSEKEHFIKSVESAGKVLEIIDIIQMNGDADLEILDFMTSAMVFSFLGRLMTKYLERFNSSSTTPTSLNTLSSPIWPNVNDSGNDDETIRKLTEYKEKFSRSLRILGKKRRFASISSQLLENVAFGSEFKLGEYERPDNMP